jgi:succinate dehydrogenase / fumarate reductase, cytochrome b subunit
MHRNPSRPLSPHLTIWRWGPHMLVSILHRITGSGLATVGAIVLVWWLAAAASSEQAYQDFVGWARHPIGVIVGIGLTWALFQHSVSGVRHFVMDIGAGYELQTNKRWATLSVVIALVLTALLWIYIFAVRA